MDYNISRNYVGNENTINKLIFSFKKKKLPNSIIIAGDKGIGKNTLVFSFIANLFNNFLNPDKKKK